MREGGGGGRGEGEGEGKGEVICCFCLRDTLPPYLRGA